MIDWGRELKVSNETDPCVHQETLSQELLNTNTELINKLTMNRKHSNSRWKTGRSPLGAETAETLFAHWRRWKCKVMEMSRVLPGTEDHPWRQLAMALLKLIQECVRAGVCICACMCMCMHVHVHACMCVIFFFSISFFQEWL